MRLSVDQGFSTFVETQMAWHLLLHFQFGRSAVGMRICISSKFPHAATTAGLGTTLLEPSSRCSQLPSDCTGSLSVGQQR